MSIIRFDPPYREGVVKSWVRRHFATQTSRLGLPESRHEYIRRRMLQGMAALTLLAFMVTGTLIYFFVIPFWCGWVVLIELASKWQGEQMRFAIDSDDELDKDLPRGFGDN